MPGRNDESLIQCAVKDEADVCRQRLAAGSDPSSANPMGQSALHIAAIWGSMQVGELLIEAGATVEAHNKMGGITPLMCAAQRGRTEFARMLLSRGADPKTQDESGRVAFMFAEDDELRELLGGPSGELCRAVRTGDLQQVEDVTNRRPELVATTDGSGNTPLVTAMQMQSWKIAHWLLRHADAGKFVNTRSSNGDSPLQLAARFEQAQLVGALIHAGADVNRKSLRINECTRRNYEMVDPETGEKKVVYSEHQTPTFDSADNGDADM
jgi:ankyrin repeat protein